MYFVRLLSTPFETDLITPNKRKGVFQILVEEEVISDFRIEIQGKFKYQEKVVLKVTKEHLLQFVNATKSIKLD